MARLRDRAFHGYIGVRFPHPYDDVVAALVAEYRSLEGTERERFTRPVDDRVAGVLSAYAQRTAVLAVRSADAGHLASGVVALGIAYGLLEDPRDHLYSLAALNDAAERLGLSLADIVRKCRPEIPEPACAAFLRFCARSPRDKSAQAFGLRPQGEGGEFRYR